MQIDRTVCTSETQICMFRFVSFLFFVLVAVSYRSAGEKYRPCPLRTGVELRRLFVATCDTRVGWKEFNALKVWNITGLSLRVEGLSMKNVCKGENWGKLGFLTKPLLYLRYIRSIMSDFADNSSNYIILMDSDTFWSSDSIAKIWNKFDCARNGKPVILSTEMSCWVGRYCVDEDLSRWYNNSGLDTPSYSPFVNSGVIMGKVEEVARMLEYVVLHNSSYYTTYHKLKFDDQLAIADYAINVAPTVVALDYHQQLSASSSIHAPGNPPDEGWPFVCKSRNLELTKSCHNYTPLLRRLGHFAVNKDTCLAERRQWPGMPLDEELASLAADPVIWHGNGAGKGVYQDVGYKSFRCFLVKRNMTEQDHSNTFG